MEHKCPDETLRMRGMNPNLCILRMLEDTFLLGAAHVAFKHDYLCIVKHSPAPEEFVQLILKGISFECNEHSHKRTKSRTYLNYQCTRVTTFGQLGLIIDPNNIFKIPA